jgi:hypothetical protein
MAFGPSEPHKEGSYNAKRYEVTAISSGLKLLVVSFQPEVADCP